MRGAFDEEALVRRLASRPGRRAFRVVPARRSAVAIVLDAQSRVLLIHRAKRPGDRWSSHVSLPGGMKNPSDASLEATARRETREEVGLDLNGADCIGSLDDARAIANGGLRLLSISPFVFRWRGSAALTLSSEVSSAFWLPLQQAASGTLDGRWRQRIGGFTFSFEAWQWEGRAVWGLTLGILTRLIAEGS
jgi:8-oxo-dGTP pyrophosphatase MutT (NUDIX family)